MRMGSDMGNGVDDGIGRSASKASIKLHDISAEDAIRDFCEHYGQHLQEGFQQGQLESDELSIFQQRASSLAHVLEHNHHLTMADKDTALAWLTILNSVMEIIALSVAAERNNGEVPIDADGNFVDPIVENQNDPTMHLLMGRYLLQLVQDANYLIYTTHTEKKAEE